MPKPIYVLSGPNLNLPGTRERETSRQPTLPNPPACETFRRGMGYELAVEAAAGLAR